MDIFTAIDASSTGIAAQRARINILSGNLANINTTRTEDGGPYRRRDSIFTSEDIGNNFGQMLNQKLQENVQGVKIDGVYVDEKDPKLVYNPTHPDADEKGFVRFPNINLMEELVNIMSASRAYEANVTALNASKSMLVRALTIGGNE